MGDFGGVVGLDICGRNDPSVIAFSIFIYQLSSTNTKPAHVHFGNTLFARAWRSAACRSRAAFLHGGPPPMRTHFDTLAAVTSRRTSRQNVASLGRYICSQFACVFYSWCAIKFVTKSRSTSPFYTYTHTHTAPRLHVKLLALTRRHGETMLRTSAFVGQLLLFLCVPISTSALDVKIGQCAL